MGKFKELRVWQDGVDLAEEIYEITGIEPFFKDYGLCNQIQRAAVSISSNIAEGDGRGTDRESVYFFNIAKGSTEEVITQLHIAHRIGYIDVANLEELENKAEKIRASLKNLIRARRPLNPNQSNLVEEALTIYEPSGVNHEPSSLGRLPSTVNHSKP
jgi:four helix bundle protein